MNNVQMADSYLKRAKARFIGAREALKRGDMPETVRYSQECVELSIKSTLRLYGIEYPRVHEVSAVLIEKSAGFPDWFRSRIDEVSSVSRQLSAVRGQAVYGDESAGVPADDLFTLKDAKRAQSEANDVLRLALRLYKEFTAKSG